MVTSVMKPGPLTFVQIGLQRMRGPCGDRKKPSILRPDRRRQSDVDEYEHAVITQAIEKSAECTGGACRTRYHTVETIRDQPDASEAQTCPDPNGGQAPLSKCDRGERTEDQATDRYGVCRHSFRDEIGEKEAACRVHEPPIGRILDPWIAAARRTLFRVAITP